MRRSTLLVVLIILSMPVASQNLITNGNFDSDLTGWVIADGLPDSRATWVNEDVDEFLESGSVELINVGEGNNGLRRTLLQCVTAEPDALYLVEAWGKAPADQPGNGGATVVALVFATPDCSGPTSALYSSVGIDNTDFWEPITGTYQTFSSTQSVLIGLAIGKRTGFSDDVSARIDAVTVVPDKIIGSDFE